MLLKLSFLKKQVLMLHSLRYSGDLMVDRHHLCQPYNVGSNTALNRQTAPAFQLCNKCLSMEEGESLDTSCFSTEAAVEKRSAG